jgi:hypothetical protein
MLNHGQEKKEAKEPIGNPLLKLNLYPQHIKRVMFMSTAMVP